jgi:hypothetical protein
MSKRKLSEDKENSPQLQNEGVFYLLFIIETHSHFKNRNCERKIISLTFFNKLRKDKDKKFGENLLCKKKICFASQIHFNQLNTQHKYLESFISFHFLILDSMFFLS